MKSCMRCYRHEEEGTGAVTHSTEKAKLCLGQPLYGCQFRSGMDRPMWEGRGAKGFLQRLAGHRQQFWTSRRVTVLL